MSSLRAGRDTVARPGPLTNQETVMTSVDNDVTADSFGEVIRVDEGQIKSHVDEIVRASVEQTLNALLDAEADAPCNARRYQRCPDRTDTRAGSYDRKLQTKAGEVTL